MVWTSLCFSPILSIGQDSGKLSLHRLDYITCIVQKSCFLPFPRHTHAFLCTQVVLYSELHGFSDEKKTVALAQLQPSVLLCLLFVYLHIVNRSPTSSIVVIIPDNIRAFKRGGSCQCVHVQYTTTHRKKRSICFDLSMLIKCL